MNRDSYQIDDDEMIRNAYAMISLQASAEDVTKDGLVDPDSGTRIIDYSTLGGRTVMSYTPGFRRITDYAAVETTGNDLPSGFEDYPQQDARQILNYDHQYQQKNTVYQGKPHFMENKGRSPYHASAIIQHDYQDRPDEFQDDYRRPDGFTNQLQTSYAPTVPTVTTTTRRLYSPTVPTTYRPSTLAYSKLDLMVDSSDHLYAHSKSPVTPPTITHQNNDMRKIDLKESETKHDDLKKSENASSSRTNKDDRKGDDPRFKNDEVRLDFEQTSETNFRINVTDVIDEDEVFRQQNDRPVIQIDSEDNSEDIETEDSIGIARALNNPLDRIIIQNQNPIYRVSKDERRSSTTPIPLQTILNHSSEFYEKADDVNSSDTLKKSDVFDETSDNRSTEDYEDIPSSTTKSFGDKTTPLLKHWEQKDIDTVQASTLSMTATPVINTTETSIDEINGEIVAPPLSNDSRIAEDQSSSSTGSISSFNDESVHKINLSFEVPQPAQFLKPPVERFLINVPEKTHYTTIDENSKTSWSSETTTTEIPRFSSTLAENNEDQSPIYDEDVIDYIDEGFSETPNPGVYSTAQVAIETSTSIPWFVSTWHDRSIVDVPVTDIVPPIVDYNDGFDDFVPPNESSYTEQFDHTEPVGSQRTQNSPTTSKKNDSEGDFLAQYNTGFQFTIRNAIKAQKESKADSRCSSISDKQGGRCETSSVIPKIAVSTPSLKERTVSIVGTKATTRIPEQLTFSSSTKKLRSPEESVTSVPDKAPTSAVKPSVNIEVEDLNLKTVTSRDVEIKDPEEKTEQTVATTVSSLLHSIRPESLKQIEETIDKHDSPYEVSLKKDEDDLETTADDFISRLISQHQRPDSILKDLDDFEIVKSVESETEIASILQTPKFPDTSHNSPDNANNNSFYIAESETASEFKPSDMSMVSLLQLMAELLKLDRLPRPFSAKELSNMELKDSFNLDPDELPYDTASPLELDQQPRIYKIANSKASNFDTLTPAKLAESKVSRNPQLNKASFATESPRLDHSQVKTPFGNADSKRSSLDGTLTTRNIDLKPPLDVSSRANSNNATKQKTSQSKSRSRIIRPLHKEEILEQLTENFGQPLHRGDSIHRSLVFDLPQVQRSLDFETGLPIEESKDASSETEEESSISTTTTTMTTQGTTTTTESVKTTIETEFLPSLGFSLDTNEGREEYVQAILGGLIDEHTENGRNKSIAQNEAPKNETLEAEQ